MTDREIEDQAEKCAESYLIRALNIVKQHETDLLEIQSPPIVAALINAIAVEVQTVALTDQIKKLAERVTEEGLAAVSDEVRILNRKG